MDIFIFRRDLRLQDNVGINNLIRNNSKILPIFIYDKKQIDRENNGYFSDKCVQFLAESLYSLKKNIEENNGKLFFFYGDTLKIIDNLIKNNAINSINFNEDYSIFSVTRDKKIYDLCQKNNLECNISMDIPLYNFKNIRTKSGNPYKKFKWFHTQTLNLNVNLPEDLHKNALFEKNIFLKKKNYSCEYELIYEKYDNNDNIIVKGGRENGIKLMNNNIKNLNKYNEIRSFPIYNKTNTTSFMSAYNKFGCISIRELYYHIMNVLGDNGFELIRQIVWRDFYYNIVYNYSETFEGNKESDVYNVKWENNEEKFYKWCNGLTGFPFVDAGMRQLKQEGYINNRVRLCCANLLVKNLHIDWRLGEKYFAQQLVDYDPCQNNGNWQWVASTGYESQAYYRYMNPDKDMERYDPECIYIKKYIEELQDETIKNIKKGTYNQTCKYPQRIVDLKESLNQFKNLVNS